MKNNKKGALTSFCGGRVTANCIERAKKSDDKNIRLKAAFAESMGIVGGRKKAQAGLHIDPAVASQLEDLQAENTTASGPQVTDKLAELQGMTAATPDDSVSPDVAAATTAATSETPETPATPNASADATTAKNNRLSGAGDLAGAAITAGAGYAANQKQKQADQTASLEENNALLANTADARNVQVENSVVGPNTGFSSGKGANSYLAGQAGSKYVARYGASKKVKGGEKIDIGFGNYKFQGKR